MLVIYVAEICVFLFLLLKYIIKKELDELDKFLGFVTSIMLVVLTISLILK